MEKSYWLSRWVKNKIGFHTPEGEPALHTWWKSVDTGKRPLHVLIPLCGKSPDIQWIADKGTHVIGVEFIEKACLDFFRERDITPQTLQKSYGTCYSSENTELWSADILKMPTKLLSKAHVVYDRAALVALPEQMRKPYVSKIAHSLRKGSKILMVSFDYPQQEMNGPPFSIPEREIKFLHEEFYSIELLETIDILSDLKKFKEKGLSYLYKQVYLMERI
jgi:thiopurine S-methyltransferase